MFDSTTRASALDYYARIGAALFPIPAGQKFGHLVPSFKHDHSRNPEQWKRWESEFPGCNFGIVAFASGLIICDIDTSGGEAGRIEAWAVWRELCLSWGLPEPLSPHVQSARGGWHSYMRIPRDIDASTFKQPDAIKKRINVRSIGYTVAAGSYYDGTAKSEESGPYILFPDKLTPHIAPQALINYCTRAPSRPLSTAIVGSRDQGDVAELLRWLNEKEVFADYESWFQIGMALKIEYGDTGYPLWELTFDSTVTPGQGESKWQSFATEPTAESVTLNSFLDRAHKLGWRGQVRKSTAAMFDGVAQLAATTGAGLYSGMPSPSNPGLPMLAGQAEITRLAQPILIDFLAATKDLPAARSADFPTLPVAMSGHGLYESMQATLSRFAALSEIKFKPARITPSLAVLYLLHADVFEAVVQRLRTDGHTLQDRKIKLAAANLSEKVERITVNHEKWECDPRTGLPEQDNPDNVAVLLGILGLEIRWNAWSERMEIQGTIDADFRYPVWTYVDDTFVAKLITRAKRTKTRFKPGKDFCWESLITFAHANTVDPVCEILDTLAKGWDGVPRLSNWLAATCDAPDDAYHRAVSLNIIGGMVRRIRQPGCKHDLMPVFFGPQGTGKSTIAKIIADMGQSTLAEIDKRSAPYFSDEVMLGDESKELVLSLAGKCLVEIGEMGQRNSAKIDHVKAMLSRQVDRGRTAYSRAVTERPRRNIFFGTVNGDQPLQDESGNRRFLPVSVPNELNLVWLSENIQALIGEAATMEAAGADFALPRDVWAAAAAKQESVRAQADFEVYLHGWFADEVSPAYIMPHDISTLLRDATGRSVPPNQYGKTMERLGFESKPTRLQGKTRRVWCRGDMPGAQAYTIHRDSSGRLLPRQMFAAITNVVPITGRGE